jgi:dTDP-glucose 4,6-dehydratase/UDP-glucose 4-epimerase
MNPDQNLLGDDLAVALARSAPLWEALRGQSLFITGGTGLFGRWLLEAILCANSTQGTGLTATVLTRKPDAFRRQCPQFFSDGAIRVIGGDVLNFDFPDEAFSHVVHMATTSAWETSHGEDQLRKFHTLLQGTERTLQFAARCGAKKVFFASSGVAYGQTPEGMQKISEDYWGAPDSTQVDSALGIAKRSAEFLCAYYAQKHQFEFTIGRCFSCVGPHLPLDLHYAVGNFIRDALYADAIVVKGDGSPMRAFLYMSDLVVWLLTLLINGRHARVYNVGSDQAISLCDLAHLVRDTVSPAKPVHVLGDSAYGSGNFVRNWYIPDIDRARRELGLDVWTSLQVAVAKTAAFARATGPFET